LAGVIVTPEGSRVRIDFNKLLQDGCERECDALRSTVESLKVTVVATQTSIALQAFGWRVSDETMQELQSFRQKCAALEAEHESLKSASAQKDQSIAEYKTKEIQLDSLQETVATDVRLLKQKIDELSQDRDEIKALCDKQHLQNRSLHKDLEASRIQISNLDTKCSTLATEKEQALQDVTAKELELT